MTEQKPQISRVAALALGAVTRGEIYFNDPNIPINGKLPRTKFTGPRDCGNPRTWQALLDRGLIEVDTASNVGKMKLTAAGSRAYYTWRKPKPRMK